jgi:hypothetical protein
MSRSVSDLQQLLRTLEPELHKGVYVYCSLPHGADLGTLRPIALVREREGLTVIATEAEADLNRWPILFRAAWITLRVHSDLQAVGLTAAFAGALSQAGISCNVIAGAFHDHLFVPVDAAQQAMAVLRGLQQRGDA